MGTITHLADIQRAMARDPAIYVSEHYAVLNTKHGLMLYNRHDPTMVDTLEEKGAWAWAEIEATKQYATGIVVDVGANIGCHTVVYAQTATRVFAFEPQPFVFCNLCANLLLNNILDVTPIMCALGSENGYTNMIVQEPTVENTPAGSRVGQGENRVAIRTLDSLGIGPVRFMKIDVEKHELEVLRGAVETLKRDRPVVYIEIHTKELVQQILPFMQKLGYSATPEVITHIAYPDMHVFDGTEMMEVYGFLFKHMEVIGE